MTSLFQESRAPVCHHHSQSPRHLTPVCWVLIWVPAPLEEPAQTGRSSLDMLLKCLLLALFLQYSEILNVISAIYTVIFIWVSLLLDFYNLILPFQKRISMNSAEQIRITRNSSLHWIVKRNTWTQHHPEMSFFSKRTRTFIKGKIFSPDCQFCKTYLIWFRVSGKSLFYENFSFKSDPNEFETRRRKTEERKLLRALVNDFTNTIV